jgi:ribonuclease T2
MFRALIVALFAALPAWAEGERTGEFDYYVLALSWTPNWCALEGDRKRSDQCDDDTGFGFTLHGLWPQYRVGWPSYCKTPHRAPSRGDTKAMIDIMGSSGLAWHEWKKHGTCAGVSAQDYFDLSREAYSKIKRPQVFRDMEKSFRIPSPVIKEAFLEDNQGLKATQIQVTCKQDAIQEVRICMTKDLDFTRCTTPVMNSCGQFPRTMAPIR